MRIALTLSLAIAASPCLADIYGYVDENGVAHLSKAPLDSRYILFKKEIEAPAEREERAMEPVAPAPAASAHQPYAALVSQVAREQGVDAALLHAVITVESGYNARARSPKGASGLMQLMPATAARYGVSDVWNPLENIRGGARLLRDLLGVFKDDLNLALAAYNAGEGAVTNSGNKIPPYAETRRYVPRVLQHYNRYRGVLNV